ncbi:serine acetyltransferase [Meridianimarinicoccus roseus]|uniref:Serine acetyltransferase n=1 Tax=Meridianimarinicoccus roseus TaxID=2072018 RepID=A0A2V2LLR8_9RHOB|nr:serine acetyltransferase [Meridianimarinicoccus roseus]PWR04544.1 serine acetyltransferase [Meridianimarinicoccus roseus]
MTVPRDLRASLDPDQLADYAAAQCNTHFPDPQPVTAEDLRGAVPSALARLGHCFAQVGNRYFFDGTQSVFSHLHGDQYAMWLYMLSNELFRQRGDTQVCSKLFLLNKALHGCDIFYEVALPDVFLLVHPLGTVLGRGSYQDYFVAYQRCGIGSNHDVYPRLGRHVTLRPGASVLGSSVVGAHCQLAAETLVLDAEIPDGTLVIGRPGHTRMKPNTSPFPLWRNIA